MTSVSVVIPARNETQRLPRCVAALTEQTLQDFELIVVDSASTDGTGALAQRLGACVVRMSEPGVARARQAGFDAATGEVIASTDADAIPAPDWLERLVAPLAAPDVVGAYGTLRFTGDGPFPHFGHAFFSRFQALNYGLRRPLFCGPNFAVRADVFRAAGGFATRRGFPHDAEDVRLAMKLRGAGKIVFLRDLPMLVSSRSLRGMRAVRYTVHHTGVYLRVCWLGRGQS